MRINDKLMKPITEVNYLRAENVERYRLIIRYFYEEHEKIHYWLHKEDVFDELMKTGFFPDYTPEMCQNDLTQLCTWGNLAAIQDTSKVMKIEDFKNRKFRYQLSEYTIEIERMTMSLENLEVEGASLEPTLLERIHNRILEIDEMLNKTPDEIHTWWNDLNNDFIRLNRNYQDYIRTLNSVKAQEMMKTEQFLIFKEKIIQYLRNFVKGLQEQALILEEYMKELDSNKIEELINIVVAYECSIPRIDKVLVAEDVYEKCSGRWKSIYNWFVGSDNEESEISRMSDITNDIIRKITRYAQQIGEMQNQGANRKEEYRHLANIFGMCENINEAHKMSAMIFGVETSLHLKNLHERETDSIDSEVFDESPTYYALEPRTRIVRNKTKRVPATDYRLEMQIEKQKQIDKQINDRKLIESFIKDNCIDFKTLPEVDAYTRKILLNWVSRGLSDKNLRGRCEWGEYYTIDNSNKDICKIKCEDGIFYMPSFKIRFERGEQ